MVSLYEILTDKYGWYYLKNNRKHRLITIEKRNKKITDILDSYDFIDYETKMNYLESHYVFYKIIDLGDKKYIQFG